MFYVLAVALCLAALFLVLTASSLLLLAARPLARRMVRTTVPQRAANILFAAQLLPFALASAVTLGLVLPAFLEFEPHSTNEAIGLQLDILALAGALILAGMAARGWHILRATARIQRRWRKNSQRVYLEGTDLPAYCVENNPSLLAVAGIFRPRVFLAREIVGTLSRQELHAALAHEFAHVSSCDNLKQLLLKITGIPSGLNPFRSGIGEWTSASEIAADHNALASGVSALDLSSALIKVARLPRPLAVDGAVASHLVPACGSSLEHRVTRLSELLQSDAQVAAPPAGHRELIVAIFLCIVLYVSSLPILLPMVHEALEFLVR
jgi:BlaR1 peptidase M56